MCAWERRSQELPFCSHVLCSPPRTVRRSQSTVHSEGGREARIDTRPHRGDGMEFGILFTSHPNPASEPYPHREVYVRVTAEIGFVAIFI